MSKRSPIRVVCLSEIGISHKPAEVLVYNGEKLVARVIASIEPEIGADGGYYSCVKLKQEKLDD